jgi:hypothetical protein
VVAATVYDQADNRLFVRHHTWREPVHLSHGGIADRAPAGHAIVDGDIMEWPAEIAAVASASATQRHHQQCPQAQSAREMPAAL